jgi:hypothetical protein
MYLTETNKFVVFLLYNTDVCPLQTNKKLPTVTIHLFLGFYYHSKSEVFRSADIRFVSLSDLDTRLTASLYDAT